MRYSLGRNRFQLKGSSWIALAAFVVPIGLASGLTTWRASVGQEREPIAPASPEVALSPLETTEPVAALSPLVADATVTKTTFGPSGEVVTEVRVGETNAYPAQPARPQAPGEWLSTTDALRYARAAAIYPAEPGQPAVFPGQPGGFPGQNQFASPGQHRFIPNSMPSPEDQKLSQETMKLASKLRGSRQDDKAKSEDREELRKLLEKQFELRQEGRRKEIAKMKEQVAELEKNVEERDRKQGEIVERRLAELLGKRDPMGWDDPSNGPGPVILPHASTIPSSGQGPSYNYYVVPSGTAAPAHPPFPNQNSMPKPVPPAAAPAPRKSDANNVSRARTDRPPTWNPADTVDTLDVVESTKQLQVMEEKVRKLEAVIRELDKKDKEGTR